MDHGMSQFVHLCRRLRHSRKASASPESANHELPPVLHPPLLPWLSFTTMKPLSCEVVQISPDFIPRSLGKLGFEAAQSMGRSKSGLLKLAHCDPGRTFVPCEGGLKYPVSFGCTGSRISNTRNPAAKQLQASVVALSGSSTLQ